MELRNNIIQLVISVLFYIITFSLSAIHPEHYIIRSRLEPDGKVYINVLSNMWRARPLS